MPENYQSIFKWIAISVLACVFYFVDFTALRDSLGSMSVVAGWVLLIIAGLIVLSYLLAQLVLFIKNRLPRGIVLFFKKHGASLDILLSAFLLAYVVYLAILKESYIVLIVLAIAFVFRYLTREKRYVTKSESTPDKT